MAVAGAVAVDPEVVVPLQVVGAHGVDQRDQLIHHPFPARRTGQADLGVERRAVVVAARGQPRLARQPRLVHRRQRHALRLDPQPELQAGAVRVVGEARQPGGEASRIDGPRSEAGVEVEVAGLAGAEVPAGVHHEQLDAEGGSAIDLGHHRMFVDAGAVDEPGVVGDERLERAAAADPLQHELAQRAGLVGRRLGGDAEEGVRQLERLGRGNRGADAGKRHADAQPIGGPFERRPPGARPHQAAEELVAPVVDEKERDELFGGASLRAEIEPLARFEVVLGEDEGALARAGAVSGVAAQAAQPAHVAERHRHVPRDQVVQRGTVAAGARDARPGLDRRRAGIAGVDAGEQEALRPVLEGEGERDAVFAGFGDGAEEGDGAARRQRDAFAPCVDGEVGRRRDAPGAAGDRVGQALQREGA